MLNLFVTNTHEQPLLFSISTIHVFYYDDVIHVLLVVKMCLAFLF